MSVQTFPPRVAVVPIAAQSSALPAWVWAEDFRIEQIPAPDELVKGILHRGSKLVLGGASKAGKTWALLDLAISVATGSDWLGFSTTQGKVLYLNLEIQAKFMQGRINSVREAKGLHAVPDLAIWNLRGNAADICKLSPEIIKAAKAEGFALIVIDPIYKVSGDRVENSAEGVASLVNELERIAVQSDAAIVFGSHFSKGNQASKDSMDRISGSGVWARDPDAILTFTAHEEAGAFTIEPTLRNFAPCDPFVVRWEFPLMRRDAGLDPAKMKKAKMGADVRYSTADILKAMGEEEWAMGALLKAVKKVSPMGQSTFYALCKVAKESNLISQSKIDNLWSVVR